VWQGMGGTHSEASVKQSSQRCEAVDMDGYAERDVCDCPIQMAWRWRYRSSPPGDIFREERGAMGYASTQRCEAGDMDRYAAGDRRHDSINRYEARVADRCVCVCVCVYADRYAAGDRCHDSMNRYEARDADRCMYIYIDI
jgi:hypothetical protein